MIGWRDIKQKALGQVHETFAIPAVYLTHAAGTPVPVDVRLHLKPMVTDQEGDFSAGAVMHDLSSRIIFKTADVPVPILSRAYVIFSNSEVYITGSTRPEREGYVWVEVAEVSKEDVEMLFAMADTSHPVWRRVLS